MPFFSINEVTSMLSSLWLVALCVPQCIY